MSQISSKVINKLDNRVLEQLTVVERGYLDQVNTIHVQFLHCLSALGSLLTDKEHFHGNLKANGLVIHHNDHSCDQCQVSGVWSLPLGPNI